MELVQIGIFTRPLIIKAKFLADCYSSQNKQRPSLFKMQNISSLIFVICPLECLFKITNEND